jgi:hypothetical protein
VTATDWMIFLGAVVFYAVVCIVGFYAIEWIKRRL